MNQIGIHSLNAQCGKCRTTENADAPVPCSLSSDI